ncbi:MAG: hypothetical protein IT518_04835 [Burkholderiales bacterium]|nr:hypothetical protein [Burkholderiales bacterium]
MRDGIPGIRMLAVGAVIVSAGIAACDWSGVADRVGDGRPHRDKEPPAHWYAARPHVLCAQLHAGSGKLWVLHVDGVDIHDATGEQRIASIRLPGWMWVRAPDACPPDFAIGPGGDVIVTSNVMPVLWRIDASSLEVTRHHPGIEEEAREIGFSRLTYSARRNVFFATGAFDGSLWRIDPTLVRARRIAPTTPGAGADSMPCPAGHRVDPGDASPR